LVSVVDYKVDKYLNLRLGEDIKALQVGYHRISIMDRIVLGLDEQVLNSTNACWIYGVQ
jgi:hypothetical protein